MELVVIFPSDAAHFTNRAHACFEAFMAVIFQVEVFWVVMPCGVAG
jgi:hypothetical protein